MAKETSIEKEVKTPKEEEMVTIVIDPEMTDGGIRINGKRYVGKVTVTVNQAEDLQRIQMEYYETKKRLTNPDSFIGTKSDIVKFNRYCADPEQNKAIFHTDSFQKYGKLDPRDWERLSPGAREMFKAERMALHGY